MTSVHLVGRCMDRLIEESAIVHSYALIKRVKEHLILTWFRYGMCVKEQEK
jgi:hypothetical protein